MLHPGRPPRARYINLVVFDRCWMCYIPGDPLGHTGTLTVGQPGANCLFWTDPESVTQLNSFTSNTEFLEVYIIESANSWWRHQMEAFSALLALCAGNSPVTGEFPSQRTSDADFDVSLIWDRIRCVCIYIYIILWPISIPVMKCLMLYTWRSDWF